MRKITKLIQNRTGNEKKYLLLWILSIVVTAIMFISYAFIDLKSLTVWSLNLLDCIWDGKLYYYYEYCAENRYGLVHTYMGSTYAALIPWAIWNIPIWILQRWMGIDAIGHAWTLLYSKLFLIIVQMITLYFMYKIAGVITDNKERKIEAVYLAFSFPLAMIAINYAGQTDIISLCLFVAAVYKFICGKKKQFFVLSILSITAKPYVLLAFIAIILLSEKNILKIIGKTLLGTIAMIAFDFTYKNAPLYSESMQEGPSAGQLDSMIGFTVANGDGVNVSLFLIMLICLYFFIYLHPWDEDNYEELMYTIVSPLILFFLFTEFEFYRAIYLMPFLYIIFLLHREWLFLNVLLETVISAGIIAKIYLSYNAFFSNWSVFQYVRDAFGMWGGEMLGTVRQLKEYPMAKDNPIVTMVSSMVFAAFVLLAALNYPGTKLVNKVNNEQKTRYELPIMVLRALLPLIPIILSFYGK